MKIAGIILAAIAAIVVLMFMGGCSKYNTFVTLSQDVDSKWSQVENVYQRRTDLIPNLVQTVQGAAKFEKETFTAVTEARSKVSQINVKTDGTGVPSPEQMQAFQNAQAGLGSALSKLMVVVEKYPDLKANANFQTLQAQLEGTENRIAVERKVFNDTAKTYNTAIKQIPLGVIVSGLGGFKEKPYFKADEGAKTAPKVNYEFGTPKAEQ